MTDLVDPRPPRYRDLWAGALVAAVGLAAFLAARHYPLGLLSRPGPGLLPAALGIALMALGVAIAWAGRPGGGGLDHTEEIGLAPSRSGNLRGGVCIVAGVSAFAALAQDLGLVPASFACVFLSAMGDRTSTLAGALALSMCLTTTVAVVFGLLLQIPLPLW